MTEAEISAGNTLPPLVKQLSSLVRPEPSATTDSAKARKAGSSCGWIAEMGVKSSCSSAYPSRLQARGLADRI